MICGSWVQIPAPPVLGQDTEPLVTPGELVGALHGFHRHWCMNVCESKAQLKAPWIKAL